MRPIVFIRGGVLKDIRLAWESMFKNRHSPKVNVTSHRSSIILDYGYIESDKATWFLY